MVLCCDMAAACTGMQATALPGTNAVFEELVDSIDHVLVPGCLYVDLVCVAHMCAPCVC
jgi:hypothetical protein